MLYSYTAEQQTLRDTCARLFSEQFPVAETRKQAEDTKYAPHFIGACRDLGLFEYFSDAQSSHFIDISLIAFEAGKVVTPFAIPASLFLGPYLVARNTLFKKAINNLGYDQKKILEGEDVAGYGFRINGNTVHFFPREANIVISCNQKTTDWKLHQAVDDSGKEKHESLDFLQHYVSLSLSSKAEMVPGIETGLYVLHAAELSGIAEIVVTMTREYLMTRKQFDVPLASFQVLQHKLVDMYVIKDALWALTEFAAWSYEESQSQSEHAAYSALHYALEKVPLLIETAIQLHGGIGFTWEHDLHLYLRRARLYAALYSGSWDTEKTLHY